MRPRISTVLTARPWEPALVDAARSSGLARIVSRCADPESLDRAAAGSDVVFIGTDTSWLTEERIKSLLRCNHVIGVVEGDRDPLARLLRRTGATIVDETVPVRRMLRAALASGLPRTESFGRTITVTGPRGAPGRSEVALALAWVSPPKTLLVETDTEAPGLGLRCALSPTEPSVRGGLRVDTMDHVSVLAPPVRGGPLSMTMLQQTIESARSLHRTVILDAGPNLQTVVGDAVIVCDPSPVGIVRCAKLLASWTGPEPHLVVNRMGADTDIQLVRRATGLEPSAMVPECSRPEPGLPPPQAMLHALESWVWRGAPGTALPA